jgi:chaperone required for assembly of F1-ATPase
LLQPLNLPKRFYKAATVAEIDGMFHLLLDGRHAKTPAKNMLALQHLLAAQLLADEWSSQKEFIDPSNMHVTRMVNAGIDHVGKVVGDVQDEIAKYATTELLCYRADQPEKLVMRQNEIWNPLLDWAQEEFGVQFILSEGVMFVAQTPKTLQKMADQVSKFTNPIALSALYTLVTIGGSLIVALAVVHKHIEAQTAYRLCELEADFTSEIYGIDEEAQFRYERREAEFVAAAKLLLAI